MTAHDGERYRFARAERLARRFVGFFYATRFASLFQDRTGAAAVTLAISLTGVAGLAGLGTEGANWYVTQRAMQSAADAAAHSAASAKSNGADKTAFTTTGKSVAANFNFSTGTGAAVNVNYPPLSGSHTTDPNAIEVTISEPMPRYLSALFISTGPTIAARSVAIANPTPTGPPCVMALDTNSETSLSLSGNPALTFNGCSLWVNSAGTGALTMGGSSTISASAAYVVGTESGAGLTTTNGLYTGVDPHPDPYASVPVPTYSGGLYTGEGSGCETNNYRLVGNGNHGGSATLPPPGSSCSVYVFHNGIDLTSANVSLTLQSGVTYIIDGGTLSVGGNATLNASGATIILTNHSGGSPANIDIKSNSTVTISAPASGTYSGVALMQDRVACTNNNCGDSMVGGSGLNVTGAIYFPDNAISYKGGSSAGGAQCTQLVAYQITFKGNSQFNSSCNTAGTKPVLVTTSQLVE